MARQNIVSFSMDKDLCAQIDLLREKAGSELSRTQFIERMMKEGCIAIEGSKTPDTLPIIRDMRNRLGKPNQDDLPAEFDKRVKHHVKQALTEFDQALASVKDEINKMKKKRPK